MVHLVMFFACSLIYLTLLRFLIDDSVVGFVLSGGHALHQSLTYLRLVKL